MLKLLCLLMYSRERNSLDIFTLMKSRRAELSQLRATINKFAQRLTMFSVTDQSLLALLTTQSNAALLGPKSIQTFLS